MNDQSQSSTLKKPGLLQYILAGIIVIGVVAAGIVAIVAPKTLSFHQYETQALPQLALAVGVLGLGKGIHLGLSNLNLGGILNTASSPAGQSIIAALEKGDVFSALSAFEGAVPQGDLPSDHTEALRPAPTPTADEFAGGAPEVEEPPPVDPPPDAPPQQQQPPPPPAQPAPLTPEELQELHDLQQRALAAGQAIPA